MIGALQYATLTQPDISFNVNKVCQFMASPMQTHWSTIKHILRYLNDTAHHGFLLSPAPSSSKLSLRAYSNSDWASDPDD